MKKELYKVTKGHDGLWKVQCHRGLVSFKTKKEAVYYAEETKKNMAKAKITIGQQERSVKQATFRVTLFTSKGTKMFRIIKADSLFEAAKNHKEKYPEDIVCEIIQIR